MIDTPSIDWLALSPVLALLAAAAMALLVAVLVPSAARRGSAPRLRAGFVGALFAAASLRRTPTRHAGHRGRDPRATGSAALAQMIVAASGLARVARRRRPRHAARATRRVLRPARGGRRGDGSWSRRNNLMTLFLGLEWFSISLYILCAIDVRRW